MRWQGQDMSRLLHPSRYLGLTGAHTVRVRLGIQNRQGPRVPPRHDAHLDETGHARGVATLREGTRTYDAVARPRNLTEGQ